VAGAGSAALRGWPFAGNAVTVEVAPGGPDKTTKFRLAGSNVLLRAGAASGRSWPSGAASTGGDTAAAAGEMVGGGASAGFDEHAATAMTVTATSPL